MQEKEIVRLNFHMLLLCFYIYHLVQTFVFISGFSNCLIRTHHYNNSYCIFRTKVFSCMHHNDNGQNQAVPFIAQQIQLHPIQREQS